MKDTKLDYTSPKLEICLLTIEQGFALSIDPMADVNDYTPGADQTHD